ncbi:hypothetical protein VPH35_135540 [Triticum aestivum]
MERDRGLQWTTPAAMELRRGCSGARPGMQWSFVGTPRAGGCNGAPRWLQWSFVGTPRAGGCNEAPPRLQWSTAGAAMELRRDAGGAASELFFRAAVLRWICSGASPVVVGVALSLFSIVSGAAALELCRWLQYCEVADAGTTVRWD